MHRAMLKRQKVDFIEVIPGTFASQKVQSVPPKARTNNKNNKTGHTGTSTQPNPSTSLGAQEKKKKRWQFQKNKCHISHDIGIKFLDTKALQDLIDKLNINEEITTLQIPRTIATMLPRHVQRSSETLRLYDESEASLVRCALPAYPKSNGHKLPFCSTRCSINRGSTNSCWKNSKIFMNCPLKGLSWMTSTMKWPSY